MESIYDRLGDLLKETLEAGSVKFVRVELPEDEKDGGCHPENELVILSIFSCFCSLSICLLWGENCKFRSSYHF